MPNSTNIPSSTDDRRFDASPTGVPGGDGAAQAKTTTGAGPRRPWWYHLVQGGLAAVATLLGVVLVGALLLMTGWGAERTRLLLNKQLAALIEDGTFEIGRIEGGNLFRGAWVHDIVIAQDGEPVVTVDSARVDYALGALINRRIQLDALYLADVALVLRQRADSSWNVASLFVAGEEDSTATPYTFILSKAELVRGDVAVHFYNPARDSILRVSDLGLRLSDALFRPDTLAARLDTLYANLTPPDLDEAWPVAASGAVGQGTFTVDAFRLRTPRTDLSAAGSLALANDGGLADVALDLNATPLAFADLRALAPAFPLYGTPTISARITDAGDAFAVTGDVQMDDGGRIVLDGTFDTRQAVVYAGKAEIRRLDLGRLLGDPALEARLNADATLALRGDELGSISGPIDVTLFDTRYAGQRIQRATLGARFTEGRAALTLRATLPGGSVRAEGRVSPFLDVPTYDLTGRFQNVDLARLSGDPAQQGLFNGTFALNGRGVAPETAQADVRLTLTDSRFGNTALERVGFDGRLDDGTFRGTLDAGLGAGSLTADLVANPFLATPTYRLDGRFAALDLAALSVEPGGTSSDLTGTFRVEGEGFDLAAADARVNLRLAPSRVNALEIETLALDGRLRGGVFQLDASATIPGGAFTANGTVRNLTAARPRFALDGSFTELNLAGLSGEGGTPTNFTGTFSVNGRGFDPATLQLDGSLDLGPSSFGTIQIAEADGRIRLARSTLGYDVRADFGANGRLAAEGTARPFDDVISYSIERGRMTNLNLAAFTTDSTTTSDLNGTFTLSGSGVDPQEAAFTARLDLEASRYNRQQIEQGTGTLRLDDGLLRFDINALAPEGQITFTGSFRPFDENPSFALDQGRVVGLDLGALLNNPALSTSLTGTLRGTVDGFDPATSRMDVAFDLEASRINRADVEGGTLRVISAEGVFDIDAELRLPRGLLDIEARVSGLDSASVLTYDARGTLRNVDVFALAGIEDTLGTRVFAAFDVEGQGTDPATLEATGNVRLWNSRFMGTRLDTLVTRFTAARGVATVDTLLMRSQIADVTGGGRIVLPGAAADLVSDFNLAATLKNLTPIQPLIGAQRVLGEGDLTASYIGPADRPQLIVRPSLRYLTFNDYRLADLEGTLTAYPGDSLRVDTNLKLGFLSTPFLTIQQTTLALSYNGDDATFRVNVRVDGRRDAVIAGRVDLLTGQEQIVFENLDLRFDEERWELLQEARVAYGDEIRFRNFLLFSGDQQIAIDGAFSTAGDLTLTTTIESVELDAFADLLGYPAVGGTMTGSIAMSGTARDPILTGDLSLVALKSGGTDVGAMTLGVHYEDYRLGLDTRLTHDDGSTLTAEGTLPFELTFTDDAPPPPSRTGADFRVVADSFAIGWVQPFLPPESVSRLEGRLVGAMTVGGTRTQPNLGGELRLVDGEIGLPALGQTYRGIVGEIAFAGDTATLERLLLRSGDGTAFVDGTLTFPNLTLGNLDLTVSAEDFRVIDTDEYSALTSGDVFVQGPLDRLSVSGDVVIEQADINLDLGGNVAEEVELTERDRQMLLSRFGVNVAADSLSSPILESMALDLDVEIDRNVWLRSGGEVGSLTLDIEFTGDLDLVKAHGAELPLLFGTLEAVPERSRVEQFGKRFVVDDTTPSRIIFNGPVEEAYIDIRARLAERRRTFAGSGGGGIEIYLDAEGALDALEISFSSNADMSTADILAYIISGAPAGEGFLAGGNNSNLGSLGATLLSGTLSSELEGVVGGVGLDVVELDYNVRTQAIALVLGEYLTRQLYGAVSVPINSTDEEGGAGIGLIVEYQLFQWLIGRLEYQEIQARDEQVNAILFYLVFSYAW